MQALAHTATAVRRPGAYRAGGSFAALTHPDDRQSDVDIAWRILAGELDTVTLRIRSGKHERDVRVDYNGGHRFPHLEPNGRPRRLDDILRSKPATTLT